MSESLMAQFLSSSHFSGGNAAYVEDLYDDYLHEPAAVSEEWRRFFDQLPKTNGSSRSDVSHATIVQHFELLVDARLGLLRRLVPVEYISSTSESRFVWCN